jgi:hypothetical protein
MDNKEKQMIKDFLNTFFNIINENMDIVSLDIDKFSKFFNKYFPEENFNSPNETNKRKLIKKFITEYQDILSIYGITCSGKHPNYSDISLDYYYNNKAIMFW